MTFTRERGDQVDDPKLLWRVAGLGAIAGMRSMAAPAALSRAVERGDISGLEDTPFGALGTSGVASALRILALGEMLVDKLPVAPSRTSLPPLAGRAASGAFVGAALFASGRRPVVSGGLLGAVSALVGAYAGERVRLLGAHKLGVPDLLLAALEDGIVLLGASRLLP